MKDHITIAGHDGAFAAYIARLKTVPAASEDVLTAESDYQRQQRALSCRQTESNLMPGVAGLVMGSRRVGSVASDFQIKGKLETERLTEWDHRCTAQTQRCSSYEGSTTVCLADIRGDLS